MKSIETTGNTVPEALQKGLNELGVTQSDVDVKVLATPKAGFFGLGATKARVLLTIKDKKTALEELEAETFNSDLTNLETLEVKSYKTTLTQNEKNAKEFVDELLSKMKVNAVANVCDTLDTNVHLDITGEGLGTIIGRRGETLDAIQYITTLATKDVQSEKYKVLIDAENYRAKRMESLKNVATKMSQKVLKSKKNMTLEPMSPFERRVIHEFLQEKAGVHTFSTGKEPNRRLVIGYGEGKK